jgi:NitT/TauT family transport system permease protein
MPDRPETIHQVSENAFEVIERPVSAWERFYGNAALRKLVLLLVLAAIWEISARWYGKSLLLPSLSETLKAFVDQAGPLSQAAAWTIVRLLKGYSLGLLLAIVLTAIASVTRIGADFLETLTSMLNPLPSIALVPISLIWFAVSENGLIFVLVNAVLWSVALNTYAGFRGVSPTLRMVGRNYGLSTVGYITRILIPGAFPSILTGLKIGWAFAWRTIIASEMVYGVSGEKVGLGRYINDESNLSHTPGVFAGLLMVILLGLAVESLIFKTVEKRTVRRWGMET